MTTGTKVHGITYQRREHETVDVTIRWGMATASFSLSGIKVDSFSVHDSRISFRTGEDNKEVALDVTIPISAFI